MQGGYRREPYKDWCYGSGKASEKQIDGGKTQRQNGRDRALDGFRVEIWILRSTDGKDEQQQTFQETHLERRR
jgi:hypothetical protein